MGLFGFLKGGNKPVASGTVGWLQKADAAYTYAMQSRDVSQLDTYFTRSCIQKIAEQARMQEKLYSGLDRYRHTNWAEVTQSEGSSTWLKEVTYDNVEMSHGVTVPVGDNYREHWIIVIDTQSQKISEIRRVS